MSLALLRVEGVFHWGFWVRQAYASARQDTLPVPPPSTLVGALASGLAAALRDLCGVGVAELRYSNGVAEVPLIRELISVNTIRGVYFRILNGLAIKRVDITRHFQAPYIRTDNWGDKTQWYAVRGVGKVYAVNTVFESAYLIDVEKAESFAKRVCSSMDPLKLFVLGAMNMSRLGPVEAVVTPRRIEVKEVTCESITQIPDKPCPYFEISEDIRDRLSKAGFTLSNATLVGFWNWRTPEFWSSNRRPDNVVWYVVPVDGASLEAGIVPRFSSCILIDKVLAQVGRGVYVGEDLYPYTPSTI
jgi:CRISPR-associated Cas5-like protein